MKIENKDVTIKIGNKEKSFKNLILDRYIELFRDSFLEFKEKALRNCFIKFNATQEINEKSTSMDYDVFVQTEYRDIHEQYINNSIINKYIYDTKVVTEKGKENEAPKTMKDYAGSKICGIGFGQINRVQNNLGEYEDKVEIYAFLDVSKYDIIVQENQEIKISRTDKISSDLLFFSPFSDIKCPYHLSIAGLLVTLGMEYTEVYPKLKSVCFGNLYNLVRDEISIEDILVENEGFDAINIGPINLKNEGGGLYPSYDLYPSPDLYPAKATPRWIILKFELYQNKWATSEWEDTGRFYYQSLYTEAFGNLKLKIKYERG